MNNSDEMLNSLLRQGARDGALSLLGNNTVNKTNSGPNPTPNSDDKIMFIILGILVFVGAEAVKVIFRRNFGGAGIKIPRIFLCFLFFLGVAVLAFFQVNSDTEFATESGTSNSHLITGILFTILAFFVLIQGIHHRQKAIQGNYLSDYQGDSHLLGLLLKDGWKQTTIQNLAEPLLTLSVGIFFCFLNLIGGIAIVFCAVSVWGYLLIEWLFKSSSPQQHDGKYDEPDSFNEIKTN